VLLSTLLASACGDPPPPTPPDAPPAKVDAQADFLKQRVAAQQRTAAKNDGERLAYVTHGDAKAVIAAMLESAKPPEVHEEPVAAPKGPRAPGIKGPEANTGTIDTNAVASVFRKQQNSLQSCYERGLKRDPKLTGKVKLMITISSEGKVRSVNVGANSLGDATVLSCMKSRVKDWVFPKPEGGQVTVAKTFVFTAQGG